MILDEARGPARAKAGLIWHLVGGEEIAAGHFRLRGSDAPVEVRLTPLDDGRMGVWERRDSMPKMDVAYWGTSKLCAAIVCPGR